MSDVIDVVIPTYQNREELRACLDSLERQGSSDIRAIVCVDGSTDGTVEDLAEGPRSFPVVVLEHPDRGNHGRSATRNLALPHLRAPTVLLLDSDMELAPGAVDAHLRMTTVTDVVSIGAILYVRTTGDLWARYQATRGRNRSKPGSQVRSVDFMSANSALRSEHLRFVGGFDEGLSGYGGEDTELGIRLATDRGIPFVFNADAVAITLERKSVADGLAQLDAFARDNLRRIRRRHPSAIAPFWIDRLDSVSVRDRALRLALNPVVERVVRLLLPVSPFVVQRRLLDYLVIRTVFRGFAEGPK